MKRILYSLVGLFLFSSAASAQSEVTQIHMKDSKKSNSGDDQVFKYKNGNQRLSNYDDTIWFDSFDSTSFWNIDNQATGGGWQIASNLGTWYFPANQDINSTTGGNYAVMVPQDPNNANSTLHRITLANPIDISAYSNQNLVLSYEKFGARFYDTLKVEVSNNGLNWTTLDNNTDFPLLSTAGGSVLANPTSRDLFIPISIVNGSDLYIRFTWDADRAGVEGIGYGWYVDDVALFNVPANDLAIEKTAFFETVGISYEWYYGAIPARQAAADEMTFSAVYSNKGSVDQTNTRLDLIVSGQDNQTFSSSATSVLLSGETADTARTTTVYGPDNGVGTYTFTWNVVGDQVDDIPANNMYSVDMEVTENEYSMAPLPISSANVLGKGGTDEPYVITQGYFFNTDDTLTSMGIALDEEWTVSGASFQLSVIDENETPVAQTSIYVTDNSMITGDMVYFPLPETVIPAGFYEARIEVFAESLFLVSSQDPSHLQAAPGGGFFTRTFLSFGGQTFIEDQVYMTIRTKTEPICNPNAEVIGAVFDVSTSEPYEASIEISNVTGLTGSIFTYSWSGPSGFTSGSMNIDELAVKGDYTLVVTDADGCTAEGVFTVDGNVSVGELKNETVIMVFPNPSNGNFNVSLDNASGSYEINVTNALGQVAASRIVNSNGSNQIVEFSGLSLPTGVYNVSVANTENTNSPSIFKVVVE